MELKQATLDQEPAPLAQFYKGKRIFITGATGFVGKVTLTKLLTDLPDVDRIYIMMRPKKGKTPRERLELLIQSPPFKSRFPPLNEQELDIELMKSPGYKCQLLTEQAQARMKLIDWSKVHPLEGDMSKQELGLSEESKAELCNNVEIIFNIAASVDFNASLKNNLKDNYMGTQNILKLATNCKRLVSFVHVSTFYSNYHVSHIEERVLPMERDCERMAEFINLLPDSVCKTLETTDFMESRPNTYIYTKAMAENLVQKYQGKLPLAIVRPSIITPSVKDPMPAWVDNVNGPMGLGVLASIGILRTIEWNYYGVGDLIPCDYVANCVIVVAERTARIYPSEVKVYNCSSSSLNPITWGESFEFLRVESMKAPTYKMIRVPIDVPAYKRVNPINFKLIKFSELLFAYFIDLILLICGQKTILVKLTKKQQYGYDILKYFTLKEYTCNNDNIIQALEELNPKDRECFDFDVRKLDWLDYYTMGYFGARMHLLREDMTNVKSALFKMRILIWVMFIFKMMCLLVLGSLLWPYAAPLISTGSQPSVRH